MTDHNDKLRARIAELNDQVRKHVGRPAFHIQATNPHRIVITAGIAALPAAEQAVIFRMVRDFETFDADNDPYGVRDFGIVRHDGKSVYWKVDCYDRDLAFGSGDPADPRKTCRVLTILFASEY